jgi:transposase
MATRPTSYSREFAQRAIELCEEYPHRPLSEIARDLNVGYATLYSWMKRAGKTRRRSGSASTTAAKTPEAMQQEIERLQRELEETRKQLDFAKKAAAFFAQHHK